MRLLTQMTLHIRYVLLFTIPSLFLLQMLTVNIFSRDTLYTRWREKRNITADVVTRRIREITTTTVTPELPKNLVSKRQIDLSSPTWDEVEKRFESTGMIPGGRWRPKDGEPIARVAIVIPYRDRDSQLRVFLNNMHPLLQKQRLEYGIYVVNQIDNLPFNRAMLMNIGFTESQKFRNYSCFIFHDVDLIAENENNIYRCGEKPRHMSVLIDKYGYTPLTAYIFGGVTALTKEHLLKVNGYPNSYFGWGGEDDDMSVRIRMENGPGRSSVPAEIGRYRMLRHQREQSNPNNPMRHVLLSRARARVQLDGLNALPKKYSVVKIHQCPLHTQIDVTLNIRAIYKDKALRKLRANKWVKQFIDIQRNSTSGDVYSNTKIRKRTS